MGKEGDKNKTKDGLSKQKINFFFLLFNPQASHTRYQIQSFYKKKKKGKKRICHFPCCLCLLNPLMAAVGQHGAQIHTSTRQNGEVCTKVSLASTPGACKCTRRQSTHRGRWYYRIRVLALCSCADKMENGPWMSCLWINDRPVHSVSLDPSSLLYPAECGGVCEWGLRDYGSVLDFLCRSAVTIF